MFSAPKLFSGLFIFIALLLIVGPSNVLAAPATPTGLSQIDSTDDNINVKWNKVSGATGYQINISHTDGSNLSSITVGDVDGTSFTRPTKGQEYQLWINACDSSGCSDPSAKITAKTGTSTSTGTTTGTTTTSSDLTQLGGQPVDATNYRAPQHADYTMNNIEHSLICMLSGMSPQGKCISVGSNGQAYLFDRLPSGGAIGQLTTLTTVMYDSPPVSSMEYLAQVGQNFGVVKEAHAQVSGSGSNIIQPVLLLWQVISNIAYLIYIIIFIVIGFMIMFRQKMNPQTVITVQAALPGLVIGIILIYFSYFVAALITDMSFLSIRVVANVFEQVRVNGEILNAFSPPSKLADDSNIIYFFTSAGPDRLGDNIYEIRTGAASTLKSLNVGGELTGLFGVISRFLVSFLSDVAGDVSGIIVSVILIAALAIQFFRLFIKLLNSYIMILVTTILGPMFILMGTIPGKSNMISFWWKNLLGHSLSFPAVFATFLFAGMILKTDPLAWTASPPFFGGLDTSLLKIIVAYGIILGTPAVPDMVKKAVGAQDLGAIGQMGAAGYAAGGALLGKSAGKGYNTAMKATGQTAQQEAFARREATDKTDSGKEWSSARKAIYRILPMGK